MGATMTETQLSPDAGTRKRHEMLESSSCLPTRIAAEAASCWNQAILKIWAVSLHVASYPYWPILLWNSEKHHKFSFSPIHLPMFKHVVIAWAQVEQAQRTLTPARTRCWKETCPHYTLRSQKKTPLSLQMWRRNYFHTAGQAGMDTASRLFDRYNKLCGWVLEITARIMWLSLRNRVPETPPSVFGII